MTEQMRSSVSMKISEGPKVHPPHFWAEYKQRNFEWNAPPCRAKIFSSTYFSSWLWYFFSWNAKGWRAEKGLLGDWVRGYTKNTIRLRFSQLHPSIFHLIRISSVRQLSHCAVVTCVSFAIKFVISPFFDENFSYFPDSFFFFLPYPKTGFRVFIIRSSYALRFV